MNGYKLLIFQHAMFDNIGGYWFSDPFQSSLSRFMVKLHSHGGNSRGLGIVTAQALWRSNDSLCPKKMVPQIHYFIIVLHDMPQ